LRIADPESWVPERGSASIGPAMSGFEAYPRLYQEKSADRLTLLPRWRS
jgi:hypothetical protein